MKAEGIGPCVGSTSAMVFEAYVEWVLSPALEPGQIVVMDNLSAHKGKRVKEIVKKRGGMLLYLSPYLPDFNPIEEALIP
jgi:transposase